MSIEVDCKEQDRVLQQIDMITEQENLTHLWIYSYEWRQEVLRLFDAGPKLVSFGVFSTEEFDVEVEGMNASIEVLAQRNPDLEKIGMFELEGVADEGLASSPRLRGLMYLELYEQNDSPITSRSILSLFRGPSASLLEKVHIKSYQELEINDADRPEIASVPSEKLRTFSYVHGFRMLL